MHHLIRQEFSFRPLIHPVRRHPMGPPRIRPQHHPIEPRLDHLNIEPIVHTYDPAPSFRLHGTPYNNLGGAVKPIRIVHRIKESPALAREAERMGKDQKAQKDLNSLIDKLSQGNEQPGLGNRQVKGLKNVTESRGRNEG
jgi:hypothetical protein